MIMIIIFISNFSVAVLMKDIGKTEKGMVQEWSLEEDGFTEENGLKVLKDGME